MTLTISQDGRVTFPPEALEHLGVEPGQEIALDLLPNGHGNLHAQPEHTTDLGTGNRPSFVGMIKTDHQVTTEEINETIAKGWAGLLDDDDD